MAIEAAREAERMRMESQTERQRVAELELRQGQYKRRWASAATPSVSRTIG